LAMPQITPAAPDHWVWDPVRGGGLVIATGTHLLDLVCWCARSEPIRVSAAGVTVADHPAGFGDGLVGTVNFRSGAVASVILANLGDTELLSKWSCQLFDGARSATVFDRLRKIETWGAHAVDAVPGPTSMLSSLADAILKGAPLEADGLDGRRATLLATGLMEAARTSRVVELTSPPV
jgi:predicted dehydrogenase